MDARGTDLSDQCGQDLLGASVAHHERVLEGLASTGERVVQRGNA
jgi:hypothetical protein